MMRKIRDYGSELKVLDDKAKLLRGARLTQLGTLVNSTGADALSIEELTGALLFAINTRDAAIREEWRHQGAAFFPKHKRGFADKTRSIASRAEASDDGQASAAGDAKLQ